VGVVKCCGVGELSARAICLWILAEPTACRALDHRLLHPPGRTNARSRLRRITETIEQFDRARPLREVNDQGNPAFLLEARKPPAEGVSSQVVLLHSRSLIGAVDENVVARCAAVAVRADVKFSINTSGAAESDEDIMASTAACS
jgi:hypothetical protein